MSIFPIIKRFQDIQTSDNIVILKEETIIHQKCFRSGTIFFIIGWREIQGAPFVILSKGSWQGLVNFDAIRKRIENINQPQPK